MTTKHKHDDPILVTGAAGAVGGIGRNLTEFLLARGHKVRALVRREDERAEALRRLGAEVVEGDLTDLASMHRAIEGCGRIYFGMSVSAAYLVATINTAAVARHHGVEALDGHPALCRGGVHHLQPAGAGPCALNYAAKDVTASRTEPGVRADKSFAMQNAILTLRGRFAWAHDFN